MRRVFLGLEVPGAIRSALTLQQFLLPLPQRVAPEAMHLTLLFMGEQPDPVIEAAHDGFAALSVAPFDLRLAGLGLFGGARPRAVWAGVAPSDALLRLQARVDRAARMAGIDPPARRFVPHITLGRFAPPAPDVAMRLERGVAESRLQDGPWRVEAMVLWESHLSAKGARYDELARYDFAAAAG